MSDYAKVFLKDNYSIFLEFIIFPHALAVEGNLVHFLMKLTFRC